MPSKAIRVTPGRVATVVLCRPERRNALDGDMVQSLIDGLDDLSATDECRCIVLEGEGGNFCAGADFGDVSKSATAGIRYGAGFEALLRALETNPLPVVAKVRGAALGAGCQLIAAADLAIAEEGAQIGIPAARLGLMLDLEKIARLAREIGPRRTRELLITGRNISGAEAAVWGLVNRAVPPADLDGVVDEVADQIAGAAPLSVRGSKAALRAALDHGALDRHVDSSIFSTHDAAALAALVSEDLAEGLRALKERRAPKFRGR